MPNSNGRKKRGGSPYLFIAAVLALLIGIAVFGIQALNERAAADSERKQLFTPAPSPTVSGVSVTPAPGFSTYTPAPTATPAPTPAPEIDATVLKVGSKGDEVSRLQARLQELGYYAGKVDGDYGSGTRQAVIVFQKQHGLAADGAAGPKTLAVLYSDQAQMIVTTPMPTGLDTLAGDIPLLVNKWNVLPEDYFPADLVRIKDLAGDLLLYDDESFMGVRTAVEALIRMIGDAKQDGVDPWKVGGAYRTIADQKKIFNRRVNKYMNDDGLSRSKAESRTRLTVADPGASEHHTGLAFDLNVPGATFSDTAQYVWLKQHCWDYGFIMRYTDEKEDLTGIIGEEWHVRYVGVEHAKKIQELDLCLEEYVELLKKQ